MCCQQNLQCQMIILNRQQSRDFIYSQYNTMFNLHCWNFLFVHSSSLLTQPKQCYHPQASLLFHRVGKIPPMHYKHSNKTSQPSLTNMLCMGRWYLSIRRDDNMGFALCDILVCFQYLGTTTSCHQFVVHNKSRPSPKIYP